MVAPFLIFLKNLLVAGFVAHDQQTAAGVFHGLQRFVIGGDARSAAPGEIQRPQLFGKLDGAGFPVVESVVVEEDLLEVRGNLSSAYLHSAATSSEERSRQRCPGMSLRPQAESTHGRTSARRVKRNKRIQQKRHVVAPEIQIALVDFGDPGKLIQILDHSAFRIVND